MIYHIYQYIIYDISCSTSSCLLFNIQTCRNNSSAFPPIDLRKKERLMPFFLSTMFLLNLYTMPKQFSNAT